MFSFAKTNNIANLVVDDYVIRLVENNGKDLDSIKNIAEKTLPPNIIDNGRIIDDLAFYGFMKNLVQEWGIKQRKVRFYVPQSLIILRDLELPSSVGIEERKQYITMEIGNTIHFPFKNPVFDIYDGQNNPETNQVTLLAAPEDEIIKYIEIFSDVSLKPVAVDVQALGVYRYFIAQQKKIVSDNVYFFVEYSISSVNISIFNQHQVEFLRYQPLTNTKDQWLAVEGESITYTFEGDETNLIGEMNDQLNEINRLMNFYRFSIHHGEREVTDIIVLGDTPRLDYIVDQLTERYQLPVTLLQTDELTPANRSYIPALGLALRGGD